MEKRNRRARTPRATQPVCESMFSKSAAKNAVSRKGMAPSQFVQIFAYSRNVAHASRPVKTKSPQNCRICVPSREVSRHEVSSLSMRFRNGAVGRAVCWPVACSWSIVLGAHSLSHGLSLRIAAFVSAALLSAPLRPQSSNAYDPSFRRVRIC